MQTCFYNAAGILMHINELNTASDNALSEITELEFFLVQNQLYHFH